MTAHEQPISVSPAPPRPSPREFQTGETAAGFRVLGQIGSGADSRVYLAEDVETGWKVALKVTEDGRHEAELLGKLDHSGIVSLHGIQDSGGKHVLILDYLPGPSLVDWFNPGSETHPDFFPASKKNRRRFAGRVAKEISAALEHAHARGIHHLDVKPENILFNETGRAVLIDFHVAAEIARSERETKALWGGTLAYMSPEQLETIAGASAHVESSHIDHRSDIYSMGLVYFEMLTGRQLFSIIGEGASPVESAREALAQRLRQDVIAENLRVLPRRERIVISNCLSPNPQNRYSSAEHLSRDIDRLATDSASQSRLVAFFSLVAVLAIALICAVYWNQATVAKELKRLDRQLLYSIKKEEQATIEELMKRNRLTQHRAWFETDRLKEARSRVQHHLAMVAIQSGHFEQAIRITDQLLKDDPTSGEAWHNRGIALFRQERFHAAVSSFSKAFSHGADEAESLAARAAAYGAMNQWENAAADIARAKTINPDSPSVRRQSELLEEMSTKTSE